MIILFKAVLLIAVFGLGYLVLFKIQQRIFQRVLTLLTGIVLCIFVIIPEASTRVAAMVGIGRGADFIFYLSHLFLFFLVVKQYLMIQKINERLTILTRHITILESKNPS